MKRLRYRLRNDAPAPVAPPEWVALALVLALAAAVRFWEATRTPLWFDEIFTLWVARLDLGALLSSLARDMHPPLHFLMEHVWTRLGGEGDLWLKSLSVLTGVATVAALWALTRELLGGGGALAAALLLALHRVHVYYSQEARSYALLWLWYVLTAWMAWRWVARGRRRDGAGFVLASAAALYTHYQAATVLVFVALWGLITLARNDPRRLGGWVRLHLIVAVLFAPQLPTLAGQWRRFGSEHWISPASPTLFMNVFRQYACGVAAAIVPLAVLAVAPLLRSRTRRAAVFLWTISLVPVLVTYAESGVGANLFTDRYMMFALPAWCALVVAGVAALPRRLLVRVPVTLAVFGLAVRTLVVHDPFPEAAALARAGAWLRAHVRPADVVACADTHAWYYLRQHEPALGRQVLVMTGPHLPFFEGALFVPDSARVRLAAWDSLTAGARWYGVRVQKGGVDSRPALERMMHGAHGAEGFGAVTVIAGQ